MFIAFYDAAVSLSCGKQNFEKGESGAAHSRRLLEVSVQQTLESAAVTSFVFCHFMNGVMDSVQTQLFCFGCDFFFASASAVFSSNAQLQVFLGGGGYNLAQQLCKSLAA